MILLSSILEAAPHESVFYDPSGSCFRSFPSDRQITYIVGDYPLSLFPVESLFFVYCDSQVTEWAARVVPGGFLATSVPCEFLPNVEKAGRFWVYRKPEYHLPGESYRLSYLDLPGEFDFGSLSGVGDAFVVDLKVAGYLSSIGHRVYMISELHKYYDSCETYRRFGIRGEMLTPGSRLLEESVDLVVVPAFSLSWYWVLRPGGVLLVGSGSVEMFDCFPGADRVGSYWAIRRPLLFSGGSYTISF